MPARPPGRRSPSSGPSQSPGLACSLVHSPDTIAALEIIANIDLVIRGCPQFYFISRTESRTYLALPLHLSAGPAPREGYFHLLADREPSAVAHDLAFARFGDAIAAIEHVLRIQMLEMRCRTGHRRRCGFDPAACSVAQAPSHFRI